MQRSWSTATMPASPFVMAPAGHTCRQLGSAQCMHEVDSVTFSPFAFTYREMRRLSGTPEITDAQIAWAYGQFLVRIPVAKLRQIDALRERGIRTCVLSNNNPASMKYIRRMFTADGKTMDDYFDAVFLSYELHELKPSEAIFRKMIAAGGMRPEETLFIDDGQKNVDAAQRLGFAVYMPGPGEDFGHILDNLNRYEEIL